MYTGSYDGKVLGWDLGAEGGFEVDGPGHGNQVVGLGAVQDKVVSCGLDDSFRSLSVKDNVFEYVFASHF